MLEVGGAAIATDKEGYLADLEQWSTDVAILLAQQDGIELGAAHWEIIHLLRQFYVTYQLSPAMRPLVKYIQQHLGADKGKSLYLLQLFPGSPAKLAAKIAGLPRPTNCM